ncbi:hypothetical protein [Okeania sp. SIO1I7]|uniref:hypothetical protein n=1 Tax=Okeania sp. SIO1I7 TaxID=2607772 RepID=UPI0013FC112D|nr:hypothetical protein [Okeania sp. SIO1I7]NET30001.1 hypothetical protein [Okeania sp. SIO1I7]
MKAKVRVGGTFPSPIPYGSVKIEVEREVPTHDTVIKVANELKLEVANLAAGSDSIELEKCLKVVNYPDKHDKIMELRTLCDAYQYEIAIRKENLKRNYPRMIKLKALMANQEVIQGISGKHGISDEFWDDVKEAIANEEQRIQEGGDDLTYSAEKVFFEKVVNDNVELL